MARAAPRPPDASRLDNFKPASRLDNFKPASRLDGIQAARAIAACAVVLYHTARHVDRAYGLGWARHLFQAGHAGVDLFFVLSGFIILFVHWRDIDVPARLPRYAARRVSRVLPLYWVALAGTLAIAALSHHRFPAAGHILGSLLLLPSDTPPVLGVAWTLQYEIVFYAAFAVLIFSRRAGWAIFAFWAGAILIALAGWRWPVLPASLSGAYNLEFFLGLAIAWRLRSGHLPAPRAILALGITAFAIAAIAEDGGWLDGYADTARLIYGPAAAAILAGLAELSRQHGLRVPRLLLGLGRASYAIYLFQFIGIGVLWQAWLHVPGLAAALGAARAPVAFLLLSTGAIGLGVLASVGIEYPLLRMLRPAAAE